MENSISGKDVYAVAVKAFLERDGHLFIFKDRFGDWDLPGGRLLKHEFDVPLEDVLRRKMSEELGSDIEYNIGQPAVFMRHQRVEAGPDNATTRIFAIGYYVQFVRGEIRPSPQHVETKWVRRDELRPEDYFTGGWLKGVREFLDNRARP